MLSKEGIEIRSQIVKETLQNDISIQEQRISWEEYAITLELAEGVACKKETISNVPCLWVTDQSCDHKQLILYVHGGGLIDGSVITHREFASRLVKETHIPVLLVAYRLAPENPYPAGLNDVSAVYLELLKKHFLPENIIFAGDSSGGGLALSSLIQLRDKGNKLPNKAFFISGVFDCTFKSDSMSSRESIDPFVSKDVLINCYEQYAPKINPKDPLISPVFADLSNLPELFLQVGDHEILLSDSVDLNERIKDVGGRATLKIWESMWHTWPLYADFPEAQKAIREVCCFLRD